MPTYPAEIGPGKVGARMLSRTSRINVLLRAAATAMRDRRSGPTRSCSLPFGTAVPRVHRESCFAFLSGCRGVCFMPFAPRGVCLLPLLSRVRVTESFRDSPVVP